MKSRKKNPEIAVYAELETALKEKIAEARAMEDPAARLLAFGALRQSTEGTYDEGKAKPDRYKISQRSNKQGGYGFGFGALGTLGGGTAGVFAGVAVASALTGGLAAVAGVAAGAAVLAGSAIASGVSGTKVGAFIFDHTHTAEEKHANIMFDLVRDIEGEIARLTEEKKLTSLALSPRVEEIKRAFPDLAKQFNECQKAQAKIAAKRAEFLQSHAAKKIPGHFRPEA